MAIPVPLYKYEAVAIAALCKALRGSNLQVRKPSYTYPSYWTRPVFRTAYLPINANSPWTPLVTVAGKPQYVAIIRKFVATSLGSLAVAGLEFRIVKDGLPLDIVLAPGVEFNKDGPNTYPVIPRDVFIPVNQTETLQIQVRNPTGVQRIAIGQLAGWEIDSRDSTITTDANAMVDGVYTPLVGVDYARKP